MRWEDRWTEYLCFMIFAKVFSMYCVLLKKTPFAIKECFSLWFLIIETSRKWIWDAKTNKCGKFTVFVLPLSRANSCNTEKGYLIPVKGSNFKLRIRRSPRALTIQPFLINFQLHNPLSLLLYNKASLITICSIMGRFIKEDILSSTKNVVTRPINFEESKNFKKIEDIDIGFLVSQAIQKAGSDSQTIWIWSVKVVFVFL